MPIDAAHAVGLALIAGTWFGYAFRDWLWRRRVLGRETRIGENHGDVHIHYHFDQEEDGDA